MRAHEFLTEEQLDEITRRDFLRKAGLATMGAALGTAAVDQDAHSKPRSTEKFVIFTGFLNEI